MTPTSFIHVYFLIKRYGTLLRLELYQSSQKFFTNVFLLKFGIDIVENVNIRVEGIIFPLIELRAPSLPSALL